ncbi:MAG: matrixin family metalloprotease [Gemmatimonadota bacterium]
MKLPMRLALLAAGALSAGCTDIGTPSRAVPYESRLFIPFDNGGQPAVDSLRFHWPRSSFPVRYWVEDSLEAPALVRGAIATWKEAFLYREWDAAVVSDSSSADVIVRVENIPPKPGPSTIRLASLRPECEGATDVDTVANRREFLVPVRIFLNPKFQSDSLGLCMRITATHEVGHSMGLLQHSGDVNDIMFTDPRANGLSVRDIATVEALYHRESDMHPVRP